MPDREKVITGLECCMNHKSHVKQCGACPYRENRLCEEDLGNDIFALLKENEAVEPKRGFANTQKAWFCGACGFRLNRAGRFCSKCGKKVKWE